MQRNIDFFDNNGIFVIVVQSRKAIAEKISEDKILKENERDIYTFLSSPFLERLPDSIILVQRNDDIFDLWSQVKVFLKSHSQFFVLGLISFWPAIVSPTFGYLRLWQVLGRCSQFFYQKWPGIKFDIKRRSEILSSKASEDRKSSVQRFGVPLPTQGRHYIAYPVGSTHPRYQLPLLSQLPSQNEAPSRFIKMVPTKKTIQKHSQSKIYNAKVIKQIVGGERIRWKLGRGRNPGCESHRRSLGFQVSQR